MGKLRVGRAKSNITPQQSIMMDGYSDRITRSQGIHDSLFTRAIFIEDEENSLAIVSCDVCWFTSETLNEVERIIRNNDGIDHVLYFATHNHSGPAMTELLVSADDTTLNYVESLPATIADTVHSASKNTSLVSISLSKSRAYLTFNRRRPRVGPTDPEIMTALFKDESDKPIAAITNYACHPTVLGPKNSLLSSDWPGALATSMDKILGNDALTLILNGACGDILPIRDRGNFSDVERIGQTLCQKSIESMRDSSLESEAKLSYAELTTDSVGPYGITIRLAALSVGRFVILAVPGEVFASTGLTIKGGVRSRTLMVAGYAGAYQGYFPTRDAFSRQDYETNGLCWVDSKAEEQIRINGISLVESILGRDSSV